jgi:hypothetical protein
MPHPDVARARGRHNALLRCRPAGDPDVRAAARELAAEAIADHARKIVAEWPPLTADQVERVAAILRSAPAEDAA